MFSSDPNQTSALGRLFKGSPTDMSGNTAEQQVTLNQQAADWAGAPGTALGDMNTVGTGMASGGPVKGKPVPAMVSPGEAYLSPQKVEAVKQGAKPLDIAERIPGKAKVKGDSLKNDTVPKTLESGGIVIPKHVMESQNPEGHAARFVQAIMAKQGLKGRGKARG